MTQVPPKRYSSAMATRLPSPAADARGAHAAGAAADDEEVVVVLRHGDLLVRRIGCSVKCAAPQKKSPARGRARRSRRDARPIARARLGSAGAAGSARGAGAGAAGSGAWLLTMAASLAPTFCARSRAMPRCQMSAALSSSRVTIGPSDSSFLPVSRIVEGGDGVQVLLGEHARIGERCFLLEIGAARHQRERLLVDRLDDDRLQVGVLLDQLAASARRRPAAGSCRNPRWP